MAVSKLLSVLDIWLTEHRSLGAEVKHLHKPFLPPFIIFLK